MKSWAVPKGPSFDPEDKRMAVHVEDHPISYNSFEGEIPPGQYGAGKVIIWDKGTWFPLEDPRSGYRDGKLKFELRGHKLKGHWALVRMRKKQEEKQEAWLLIKEKDEYVRSSSEFSVVDEMPESVATLPSPEERTAAVPGIRSRGRRPGKSQLYPKTPLKPDFRPPCSLNWPRWWMDRRMIRRMGLRNQVGRVSNVGADRGRHGPAFHAKWE